jgi:hypothetical protein
VAFGLLSTIKSDSVTGMWVGYQLVVALGIGVVVRFSTDPTESSDDV